MAKPKSVLEMVHIAKAEIAEENDRTKSFREKSLFISKHICLSKQLLPQINKCFQVMRKNSEMTSLWSNHFGCLKCICNEIFDHDFIGPFDSAFEDKTIAVYRLLISDLDPKL